MTPDFAVGSHERGGAGDFARPCVDCGRSVYMKDPQAYAIGKAKCLDCFMKYVETTDAKELQIILPQGWTKERFMTMLQGGLKDLER